VSFRDDLKELPYLTCCIKEAIRIHSPVPFIGRSTTKDIEVDGKTIPAGVNIDIVIYDIHHNPHIWGKDHNVSECDLSPRSSSDINWKKKVPLYD